VTRLYVVEHTAAPSQTPALSFEIDFEACGQCATTLVIARRPGQGEFSSPFRRSASNPSAIDHGYKLTLLKKMILSRVLFPLFLFV
jgi:hypothetical protein